VTNAEERASSEPDRHAALQDADENRRLRRTMRDLVALSTLPAVWIGLPLAGIARSLADVLLNMLSLDLVYIRLAAPAGKGTEVAAGRRAPDADAVRVLLDEAVTADAGAGPIAVADFMGAGPLRLTVTRFGVGEQHGILVAGSCDAAFPTERERFLLGVGANQTAIVLQRRSAEDETHEQRERLLVTLASIGDGVLTTDPEGRVTFLNPVAESLTGWTLDEATGRPIASVFPIVNEETRAPAENPVSRVLRDGRVVGLGNHTVLIARDGIERPIDDSAAPIRGRGGEMVGCVLVFRDISEKRRVEAELRQAGERARTILESITDAFFALDHEWRFTYVNQQAEKVLGRSDLLGQVLWDVYPGLAGSEFERVYRAAGQQVAGSVTSYFPDHDRWYEVHAYPAPNGIAVYFRDATDQKHAEERLREAEEQFRAMADNIPQLSWMARSDGSVFWFNRRWYDYTGTTFERMQGDGWYGVVGAEDLARVRDKFRRSIEAGEPWEDTFALRRHDGELRWHLSRAMPIKDERGRVLRWFGSNTDITEQRKMAADLSEADRRKNEFLATLAHELRNPLAPIRTGLEVLKLSGEGGEAVERARTMMDRQLGQMVRLVDDLMDVSRITSGKIELRRERVPLAAVLNSAIETTRPLIQTMNQHVSLELPEQPVTLDADVTRLAQVFMNLLNNAAKYSERGSLIRVRAERIGGEVAVSVKDTGIGIAADQLARVFDMFSQTDRAIDRSQGGLGIGLTLVKKLVEMHGGHVEARSAGPDMGSEFLVRLPLVEQPVAAQAQASHEEPLAKTSFRILIVDDNEDGAETLATMLGFMGNETRVAYDGEQALAAAADFDPEVVLLDIGLPKMDGYEACRRIRARPGGPGMFIVAQTGWGQTEDRERTRDAGFDHHMVKPLDPKALQRLLTDLQSRRATP
jgi:PAS domain S-box-containing protein